MTASRFSHATVAAASIILGASCTSVLDPAQQHAAATRAVNQWVARHPDQWSLSLDSERTLVRPEWSTSCSQGGKNNFVTLRYASADTEIDFHFRCPLDATAGVDELRSAFAFVVLSELPHGIKLPGWEFVVLTPSSSVSSGVTFDAAGAGRMTIHVDTPLYSVYGRSLHPSCQPPADAPALPGCWVSREHRIPLRLTLRARIDSSQFD